MMKGAWVELLEEQYGKAEGRREGRQEGRWDVAKNMVVKGMDVNTIVEVTGLTVDDVLHLKTETGTNASAYARFDSKKTLLIKIFSKKH